MIVVCLDAKRPRGRPGPPLKRRSITAAASIAANQWGGPRCRGRRGGGRGFAVMGGDSDMSFRSPSDRSWRPWCGWCPWRARGVTYWRRTGSTFRARRCESWRRAVRQTSTSDHARTYRKRPRPTLHQLVCQQFAKNCGSTRCHEALRGTPLPFQTPAPVGLRPVGHARGRLAGGWG